MMKGIVRFALLASIASTAVISHGAYAQDSAVTAQSAAVPDAGTGDIVVTAQRRSEKQSQVPISLTAFTADSLARTGVNDARTLTQVTPGLNFQSVGSSAQPSIRGIGSTGSSVGDSSNVSMYIDGVYQPFQAANFVRFVDIERIEVLKGPQGTLFGRNAAGGAISITTLSPKLDETTGKFGISYSRFDQIEGIGFLSTPVSENVAVSLSGNYTHSEGFRQDINLNKKLGYLHAWNTRGKILAQPSDTTKIVLSGFYSRSNDLTTFGNQPYQGDAPAARHRPGNPDPDQAEHVGAQPHADQPGEIGRWQPEHRAGSGLRDPHLAQRLFEGAAICPHRFRSDAGGFLAIEHQLRRRYDLAGFHPGIGQ